MARKKRSTVAIVAGAAAAGLGAGLALERFLVGRDRVRPDPYSGVPYGRATGKRMMVKTSDGASLAVEEFGSNEKAGVVMLHGYCLDRTIWHHQHSLDQSLKLLVYDARHHGLSAGGSERIDVKVLASDLHTIVESSGLESVVLIGHSMGGMTVLEFCRQYPEELRSRVKGIVLVNTTYTDAVKTIFAAEVIGPLERRTRRLFELMMDDSRASRVAKLRGDDLSWLLVRWFGFGKGASPTQVDYTRRLLACFPSPPLIEILRGLRDFDMEDALESIEVPCLILAGGDDRITTVRASERIHEEIAGSKIHIFEGAGHMSMMERENEFNGVVFPFVKNLLGNAD